MLKHRFADDQNLSVLSFCVRSRRVIQIKDLFPLQAQSVQKSFVNILHETWVKLKLQLKINLPPICLRQGKIIIFQLLCWEFANFLQYIIRSALLTDSKCGVLRPPCSASIINAERFTLSFPNKIKNDFIDFLNLISSM